MSDIQVNSVLSSTVATMPVGRRKMMGSMAALSVAATMGVPAFASTRTALTTYTGRYGIPGGAIIDGFMAAPRGKTGLPVVVVMSSNGSSAARRSMAEDYATAGYLAIAPEGVTGGDGATLTTVLSHLKRMPRSNGTVRVVAA